MKMPSFFAAHLIAAHLGALALGAACGVSDGSAPRATANEAVRAACIGETPDAEEHAVQSAVVRALFGTVATRIVAEDATGAMGEPGGWAEGAGPAPRPDTVAAFQARNAQPACLRRPFDGTPPTELLSAAQTGAAFGGGGDLGAAWQRFYAEHPGAQGLLRLSRVGFDARRRQALVYVGNQRQALDGTGEWILLEKQDGGWAIVRRQVIWVS